MPSLPIGGYNPVSRSDLTDVQMTRDSIAQEALALPPEDRAYVADLLEGSLQECDIADPMIAAAWSREIDRRIEAYKRGETTAVECDVAIERMREALEQHRATQARRS